MFFTMLLDIVVQIRNIVMFSERCDLLTWIRLEAGLEVGLATASCIDFGPCRMAVWTFVAWRPVSLLSGAPREEKSETLAWARVAVALSGGDDRKSGVAVVVGPAVRRCGWTTVGMRVRAA